MATTDLSFATIATTSEHDDPTTDAATRRHGIVFGFVGYLPAEVRT